MLNSWIRERKKNEKIHKIILNFQIWRQKVNDNALCQTSISSFFDKNFVDPENKTHIGLMTIHFAILLKILTVTKYW